VKQAKILFFVVISLFALVLGSCVPGGAQPARGWSGTAVHDGILYTGSVDGRVVAINSSTGNLEWSYTIAPVAAPSSGLSCGQTSAPTAIYGTPIVDGDMVYIGSYGGKVVALNTSARSRDLTFPQNRYGEWEKDCPKTGTSRGMSCGQIQENNAIVASLVLYGDAIYLSSSKGRVYSLDKGSGDENWKREDIPVLGEKLWTTPVIEGDAIYVSTFDGHIVTLSVETGDLLPGFFESESGFASHPVIYENTIYVGSFDNKLYAVKIGASELSWSFPGGNWFWAAPLVSEGVVYAGCLDGKVYAIDAQTGERLWEFDAGNPMVSSPVLMDNLLIVADELGSVYVFDLNAELGDKAIVPLKIISVGAVVEGSLFAQEGLVYIRAQDNWVYVLDIDRGGLSWKSPLTIEE
jgi:outer membrane protein assembly factor BamB